jgi:hypothetical protein
VKPTAVAATVAIAVSAVLAACDRQDPAGGATGGTPPSTVSGGARTAPATPPTATERRESTQPVQGQVDSKEPAQRKDFEHPQQNQAPKPAN